MRYRINIANDCLQAIYYIYSISYGEANQREEADFLRIRAGMAELLQYNKYI